MICSAFGLYILNRGKGTDVLWKEMKGRETTDGGGSGADVFDLPLLFDELKKSKTPSSSSSQRFNLLPSFSVCICRLFCNWRRHFKQIPLLPTPLPHRRRTAPPLFSHAVGNTHTKINERRDEEEA